VRNAARDRGEAQRLIATLGELLTKPRCVAVSSKNSAALARELAEKGYTNRPAAPKPCWCWQLMLTNWSP
jgi:hypothetical protein